MCAWRGNKNCRLESHDSKKARAALQKCPIITNSVRLLVQILVTLTHSLDRSPSGLCLVLLCTYVVRYPHVEHWDSTPMKGGNSPACDWVGLSANTDLLAFRNPTWVTKSSVLLLSFSYARPGCPCCLKMLTTGCVPAHSSSIAIGVSWSIGFRRSNLASGYMGCFVSLFRVFLFCKYLVRVCLGL